MKTPPDGCVTAEGLLCQRCPQLLLCSLVVNVFGRYTYSKSFVLNTYSLYSTWESCTEKARMVRQWREPQMAVSALRVSCASGVHSHFLVQKL